MDGENKQKVIFQDIDILKTAITSQTIAIMDLASLLSSALNSEGIDFFKDGKNDDWAKRLTHHLNQMVDATHVLMGTTPGKNNE